MFINQEKINHNLKGKEEMTPKLSEINHKRLPELTRDRLNGMRGLAVVQLYKPGCKPCEGLVPVLDELSRNPAYAGQVKFYGAHFVNSGLGQELGLNLNHVPTIVVLKDGKMLEHFTGAKYSTPLKLGEDITTKERVSADSSTIKRRLDKSLGQYLTRAPASEGAITIDSVTLPIPPGSERASYSGLAELLQAEAEGPFSVNSLITLAERYLMKEIDGRITEKPVDMVMRVAENVAQAERKYGGGDIEVQEARAKFYDMMMNLEFMPNSPTLMNAGRDLQQLSACFVLPVGDSIEGIFGAAMKGAIVHKSGGGTGYSFSRLRPAKARVQSTQGVASGPVSFMDAFNIYTEVVKQGGTRRGANMGVLRVDHPDIREFIHAKGEPNDSTKKIIDKVRKDLGLDDDDPYIKTLKRTLLEIRQLNNFNISIGATREFMEAAVKGEEYHLINPHTGEVYERVSARKMLDEIVDQAWKSGDPGIIFLDKMNRDNPTPQLGEIESTNPCGEQPLLPYESCNLGSINLARFVRRGEKGPEINYDKLRQVVHYAVHFLDNVIDMNKYPLPEIEQMTKGNRKIGLGVMGFADMAAMLRVSYGSDESLKLAEEVMKFVRDEARVASAKLAETRGVFPNWEGSIYNSKSQHFKGEELKLRNATLTTIAPTGTISMIADCESGIEPAFSLAYTKTVMDGKVLHYRARGLETVLREEGLDAEGIFAELEKGKKDKLNALPENIRALAVTSMELNPEKHIRIQAAFQKYTDNAVSKTINLPNSATREDIKNAYLLAYETGCKGITIYRDGCKSVQVLEAKTAQVDTHGLPRDLEMLMRRLNFAIPPEELERLHKKSLPKARLAIVREETVGDGKNVFFTTSYMESPQTNALVNLLERTGTPTELFIAANHFDPKTRVYMDFTAITVSKDLRWGIPLKEVVSRLKDLSAADELGYDKGFGPGGEYTNKSVLDAAWKALTGWRPPVIERHSEVKDDKPSQSAQSTSAASTEPSENEDKIRASQGFGLCPSCSRYGIKRVDGCDKCILCSYSIKGCS